MTKRQHIPHDMKKTYHTPEIEIIRMETGNIMVGSITINDDHADGGFIELDLYEDDETTAP